MPTYKVNVIGDGDGMAKGIKQQSYFVVDADTPEQAKKTAEQRMEDNWKIVKGSAKAITVVLNSTSFTNGRNKALAEIGARYPEKK